jgi:hypothetical protein
MSQIYSKRFAAALLASAFSTLYTVPSGRVAVLRCMTVGWTTTVRPAGTFEVWMSGTNSRIWRLDLAASTAGSAVWNGNLVLPAAEYIRASGSGGGSVYFTASGYEFDVA